MSRKQLENVTHLVFCGGGGRSFAHLAALRQAEPFGLSLQHIKGAAGTSSGAIIALLCLLCKNAKKMEDALQNIPTKELKDYKISNLLNFRKRFGLCDGIAIENWICKIIYNETGLINPSFETLKKETGKTLKVITTNLTQGTLCIFSPKNSPHEKVAKAIQISTAIPLFYRPHRDHNGELYVDGGLLNNYPLTVFDNDDDPQSSRPPKPQKTLGFFTRANRRGSSWDPLYKIPPSYQLTQYISRLIETMLSHESATLSPADKRRTIFIDCPQSLGLLTFSLNQRQREQLKLAAQVALEEYCKKLEENQGQSLLFSKDKRAQKQERSLLRSRL